MALAVALSMFQAAKLWERTSAKGNRYLVGRMGGVKVLVMMNTRRENDGDATHVLMFDEAQPYAGTQAAPAEPSHATPPAQQQTRRNVKRPQLDDDVPPLVDDPMPF